MPTTVWFDGESGSVRPVAVTPRIDDSVNRSSRWLPKPKKLTKPKPVNTPKPATAAGGGTGGGGGGGGNWLGFGSFGNFVGVLVVLAAAVAIGVLMYQLMNRFDPAGDTESDTKRSSGRPDAVTLERISQLPPELRRTDVNMRTEAERLMNEGRYDLAIILLFAHQLLLLDRVGLLRLSRGKTNRRYVRECQSRDGGAAGVLKQTVRLFDRSYFGEHRIDGDEFRRLWNRNDELERRVETLRAA